MSAPRLCSLECRACKEAAVSAGVTLGDKEALTFIEKHRTHEALFGTVRTAGTSGGSAHYVSAALSPLDTLAERLRDALFPEPMRAYQALLKRASMSASLPDPILQELRKLIRETRGRIETSPLGVDVSATAVMITTWIMLAKRQGMTREQLHQAVENVWSLEEV
jgi:hypothetical protein